MPNQEMHYLHISRSKISDEGTYRCELRHNFRKWISTNVDITVTAGDVAFQVDPITVFEVEFLNLTCRYRHLPNWELATFYQAKRNAHSTLLVHSETLLTTKANSSKGTASYHCTVGSRESRHVVLIHERFSKPTLRAEPGAETFEGQQLRVICFVEKSHSSNSLKYAFYHNGEDLNFTSAADLTLTEAASFKDSGVSFCEVNDLAHALKKESDDIHISVREAFSTLTLEAETEDQLFEGQQLKIICLVETNPSNSYLGYLLLARVGEHDLFGLSMVIVNVDGFINGLESRGFLEQWVFG
ncbi:Fc receptor-like protein 3 [Mustelus asterias]